VHFKANARLIGQVVQVKIVDAYAMSLRGELVIED